MGDFEAAMRKLRPFAHTAACVAALVIVPGVGASTPAPPKPRDFAGAIECAAVLKASKDWDYEAKRAAAIARTLAPANVASDEASIQKRVDAEVRLINDGQAMYYIEFDDLIEDCVKWVNAQPASPAPAKR
jgi:hypothetical protein